MFSSAVLYALPMNRSRLICYGPARAHFALRFVGHYVYVDVSAYQTTNFLTANGDNRDKVSGR